VTKTRGGATDVYQVQYVQQQSKLLEQARPTAISLLEQAKGKTVMRRFITAISIILTAFGGVPAFSQTFGDMDSSGRFGGMPPGTDRSREDYDQGGISIPIDPVETGSVTVLHPAKAECPQQGTREWRARRGDGTLKDECR
jgi:hypothetical protein